MAAGVHHDLPGTERGSTLVESLAALTVIVLVLAASAGIFHRVGVALVSSITRGRQVEAAFQAASSVRRTGTSDSVVEGFQIQISSRQAQYGQDAQLAERVPSPSCQGSCVVDPVPTVSGSSVHTVTARGTGGLTDVRIVVIQASQ
jgi:hypothetical protein